MTVLLAILTLVVSAAAAVRSTWSPCGRSMLSTITPIGERGRHGRYRSTASFFVLGALMGGTLLGLAAAALAVVVAAFGRPVLATGLAAALASFAAAASDSHLVAFALPIHRRQVNERWLDTFRPWFYGLGFGLQIGTGVATYVTTAAVYLVVALAALSGNPAVALAAGLLFGLVRGSTVLLARRVTNPEALRALHRRLHGLDRAATSTVVTIEVAAGLALLAVSWWPAVAVAGSVLLVAAATAIWARRLRASAPSSRPPTPIIPGRRDPGTEPVTPRPGRYGLSPGR